MTRKWPVRDTLDWKTQLALSVVLAFVLGLSLVLPLNDCVIGGFGDVPSVLRTTWTITTGSATLVSFVLAVRKYRVETTDSDPDDEPRDFHTAIHVGSVEGDVDLSVTLGDAQKRQLDESITARPPKDDDSDSSDSNYENADETYSGSNGTEEEATE